MLWGLQYCNPMGIEPKTAKYQQQIVSYSVFIRAGFEYNISTIFIEKKHLFYIFTFCLTPKVIYLFLKNMYCVTEIRFKMHFWWPIKLNNYNDQPDHIKNCFRVSLDLSVRPFL